MTTRFIYITDTHIGADPIGYHRQPAYPKKGFLFVRKLKEVMTKQPIDFVIHGGDLVDSCEKNIIKEANHLFQFPMPMYLCLGNHDLDRPDALEIWLESAPNLFPKRKPNYKIVSKSCVIHIIPNHWEKDKRYYWEEKQDPFFSKDQLSSLEKNIKSYPDKVHVLVTHSTVFGVYPKQSGMDEIIHEAPATFRKQLNKLITKYPHVKLVLSGHSHINTIKNYKDAVFVSGSSLVETPFEYKLIEVTKDTIKITTHELPIDKNGPFQPEYNHELCFVQGKEEDRNLFMRI